VACLVAFFGTPWAALEHLPRCRYDALVKLYHGTFAHHVASALRDGLRPRMFTDSNWKNDPSHPKMVYLTTAYPFYYGCLSRSVKTLVVFEIDGNALDQQLFHPDEDFIIELLGRHENRQLTGPEKGVVRIMIHKYRDQWRNSLRYLGNCAYRGTIPASAITRYCLFTPEARPHLTADLTDPVISTLNFEIQGDHHKKFVAWMFGDRKLLPMVAESETPEQLKLWLEQSKDRTGIEVVECGS
jgi:hypothetical protein